MLRESLRILSWLIQSHYAIQKLNATGPSAWCKSAKILHEHKILIFITYHTIQKLHECWPGPQRSKVLTDIYPKFAKLFIQRAGPKRIQHNAPWAKIMHEPKSYCLILFSQKMFKYAIQNLHKPCSSNGALVLHMSGPMFHSMMQKDRDLKQQKRFTFQIPLSTYKWRCFHCDAKMLRVQ